MRVLERCRAESRWADVGEQEVLARWSGWGAIPQVFHEGSEILAAQRLELRRLLKSDAAFASARRTTLNAHYTSASVAKAIWRAVTDLGFEAGRVLEPGCGSGTFLAFAPFHAELVGVELDPTTAEIAEHLYGARATIRSIPFEELHDSDGSYDIAIGNVPFGAARPHDPRHNRRQHSLHNYFLIKALHLVRPGGLVAALTSRYTLDSKRTSARDEMSSLADLVGAIRLPQATFAASSGTDAVTDLIILRRRPTDETPADPAWLETVPAAAVDDDGVKDGELLHINEYYATHPAHVLGQLKVGRGMYRERELTVTRTGSVDDQLASALQRVVVDARNRGITYRAAPAASPPPTTPQAEGTGPEYDLTYAQPGSFVLATDRSIGRVGGDDTMPYEPRVAKDRSELARLVGIRDAARAVLAIQQAGGTDIELGDSQAALTEQYSAYVRLYGPINRSTVARSGRRDRDTGAEIIRRIRPRMGGFRDDPDWPLVAALEIFDEETQHARPAPIFTERVVFPPSDRKAVDTAAEAVAVCLDETGTVTLDRVAALLAVGHVQARMALHELVYDDPETGSLVPAPTYLSGNVRHKLAAARAAAVDEPQYRQNIPPLERVLPRQLEPAEIAARLGAPWIPAETIEAFCNEVLGATVDIEHIPALGQWTTRLRGGARGSVTLSSEWGTGRADAVTLLEACLNQRHHTVTDPTDDGGRVRNDTETLAARDKQHALVDRFSTWIWEDDSRARRLAARYNERFSSVALPVHDGSHLTLPGLSEAFLPRQHQRDAVARILTDGRALLAHAVGAGKTATMVMAAMELRRLGAAGKPAVIVPNHMLEQFAREWIQLYPTARILVADRDRISKERRKEFVARCATGDWDGIVFTQSGFSRLPLGREILTEYLSEQLDTARDALNVSRDGKGLSVKRLERRVAQLEATYKRLLAEHAKDDGVRFEETGIDYLFVDEAHAYKNRRVDSSIDGVATAGSQRAQDLDAKLWALRRTHGHRIATFATATPVANSMAELWTMQSYLQPDLLKDLDLHCFDSWAATFGRTHTALELAPDGASYRMQTRFSRFVNVPELLTLYRQVADVRTTEDLDLPTPQLAGGKPEVVVVPSSGELEVYVADLAGRAERIRSRAVKPEDDNMLKVTGDGRRAALDLRLVGMSTANGKLPIAARKIAGIYNACRGNVYAAEGGQLALRPGALQLVFCDVSTPAGKDWNAYEELRRELIVRGVPAESIRFMQQATTDQAKAALFAACRDGAVAVLIGSTETMGVGTNVQTRAVALHHLDAPWRPADIEQREGRILRQGNLNPEVRVVRYVTEGSFDTYMWQTLERKAAFISQVTRGDLPDRDVDDIGDQALSYAEVKALATGDPVILEKAAVDAEVARLVRLQRSYHDDQRRLRRARDMAEQRATAAGRRIEILTNGLAQATDTRGDKFEMRVMGRTTDKRRDAGAALQASVADQLRAAPLGEPEPSPLGHLAGLRVFWQADTTVDREIRLLVPEALIELRYTEHDWNAIEGSNIVQRLERRIQHLPDALAQAHAERDNAETEMRKADERLGRPWEHQHTLNERQRRQEEINESLTPAAEPAASTGLAAREGHSLGAI